MTPAIAWLLVLFTAGPHPKPTFFVDNIASERVCRDLLRDLTARRHNVTGDCRPVEKLIQR